MPSMAVKTVNNSQFPTGDIDYFAIGSYTFKLDRRGRQLQLLKSKKQMKRKSNNDSKFFLRRKASKNLYAFLPNLIEQWDERIASGRGKLKMT